MAFSFIIIFRILPFVFHFAAKKWIQSDLVCRYAPRLQIGFLSFLTQHIDTMDHRLLCLLPLIHLDAVTGDITPIFRSWRIVWRRYPFLFNQGIHIYFHKPLCIYRIQYVKFYPDMYYLLQHRKCNSRPPDLKATLSDPLGSIVGLTHQE